MIAVKIHHTSLPNTKYSELVILLKSNCTTRRELVFAHAD